MPPSKRNPDPELELPRSVPTDVVVEVAGRNEAGVWGDLFVGERRLAHLLWTPEGRISHERYFDLEGRAHGIERERDDDGHVIWCAQWVHGRMHGPCIMLDATARPRSVTHFVNGRGVDIWMDGPGISEIHEMADGAPHGFTRWGDPTELSEEEHFSFGERHGISRSWTEGVLDAGYPRFYVNGEQVSREQYEIARQTDESLPAYCEQDDRPEREMPTVVTQALAEAEELAKSFDLEKYLAESDRDIAWWSEP